MSLINLAKSTKCVEIKRFFKTKIHRYLFEFALWGPAGGWNGGGGGGHVSSLIRQVRGTFLLLLVLHVADATGATKNNLNQMTESAE